MIGCRASYAAYLVRITASQSGRSEEGDIHGPRNSFMLRQRSYGVVIGAVVGALPFWVLALVRTGEQWPGQVALAVALVLSGTAFRTPAAWGLGVALGAVVSWVALAILVGTDWHLLPYVLLGAYAYYLGAIAVVVSASLFLPLRRSVR